MDILYCMYIIGQASRIDHIGLHISLMSVCVNLFILFMVMKRNHTMRFAILIFLIVDRVFMRPRGVKGVLGPSGHQGQPGLKGGILLHTKNCKYFKLKNISGNTTLCRRQGRTLLQLYGKRTSRTTRSSWSPRCPW